MLGLTISYIGCIEIFTLNFYTKWVESYAEVNDTEYKSNVIESFLSTDNAGVFIVDKLLFKTSCYKNIGRPLVATVP